MHVEFANDWSLSRFALMKSLLRIIFGVLIGIGFLAGLAFLVRQFPTAAGRIWFMFLGLGSGGLLVWLAARDLRLGVTGRRFTKYERSVSPVHFWFYILFYSLLGIFLLAVGTCSILAPNLLSLK
jgi:hypothetical protein